MSESWNQTEDCIYHDSLYLLLWKGKVWEIRPMVSWLEWEEKTDSKGRRLSGKDDVLQMAMAAM